MSVRRDDGVVLSGLNGYATPPGLCAAGGTGAGACRAAHACPRGAEDAHTACLITSTYLQHGPAVEDRRERTYSLWGVLRPGLGLGAGGLGWVVRDAAGTISAVDGWKTAGGPLGVR